MTSTPNPPRPRAVLWDLDGTLIDTAVLHWQAWRDELAAYGRELTWEEFFDRFGQRNDVTLRAWLRPDLSPEEIAVIGEAKERRFRARIRGVGLPLAAGAAHWLTTLRAQGWKQALATMAGRENVIAMFNGRQDDWFDAVVSAEQVARSKPAPDVFLRAAELLGVPPARCVVVEDSPAGIEAARRAGMKSIGVGGQALGADLTCPSLVEIPPDAFAKLLEEAP